MKAKVIADFIDKDTKKLYKAESTYEGSEDRIKELADKGHVEAPKKETKKKKESE